MDASRDEPPPTPLPPAVPPVPVLNYAQPERSDFRERMTRRVSPEVGLVLCGSIALLIAITAHVILGAAVVYAGLAWFAVAKLFQRRVARIWKVQASVAFGILGVGLILFLAPWAHEGFRNDFWRVYNQTYGGGTYRDSLRVAWAPALGTAWLVLVIVRGWGTGQAAR